MQRADASGSDGLRAAAVASVTWFRRSRDMADEGSLERWDFAGWGTASRITDLATLDARSVRVHRLDTEHRSTLGT
jgi:hypothetical protein